MRRLHLVLAAALALLMLAACGPRVVYRDRVATVSVPVAQPCAGARPDKGLALRERYADEAWAAMDLVQKTAAAGERGLERMDHADRLEAATAACP